MAFFLKAEEGRVLSPTRFFKNNHRQTCVCDLKKKIKKSSQPTNICLSFFPVDPNFYSKNLLMLGKTYLAMKDKEKALLWLTKTKEYPAHTLEDKEVHTP